MQHKDDREAFKQTARENALRLGGDRKLFQQCLDTTMALDSYAYTYQWTWLGVPIIQMPSDVMALQEVVWATKPDVIVETGVARGGSVIFFASLLELIGKGKVVGVDIDIRAHNRDTIESHPMAKRVCLIEGSSIAAETLRKVRSEIPDGARVMVVLDSDHSREHVLAELQAYAPLVTKGQYLIVADTILGFLTREQTPTARSKVWYEGDEPLAALRLFMAESDEFELDDEMNGKLMMGSSPGGYLRRRG